MNVKTDFLLQHLSLKGEGSLEELGIIILKPDCPRTEREALMSFALSNGLVPLSESERTLTEQEVLALYPESFSYSENDLAYGIDWKLETLRYMTSGDCSCYLFKGEDAVQKLVGYKYELRDRYDKDTRPEKPLSPREFNERVVRNLVHTADTNEIQNVIWLLFA